jgi:hypothetical protein
LRQLWPFPLLHHNLAWRLLHVPVLPFLPTNLNLRVGNRVPADPALRCHLLAGVLWPDFLSLWIRLLRRSGRRRNRRLRAGLQLSRWRQLPNRIQMHLRIQRNWR